MAGYNTINLLEGKSAVTLSSSIPSDKFRIGNQDRYPFIVQIYSAADPGSILLETSFDGGQSWKSFSMTDLNVYNHSSSPGSKRCLFTPATIPTDTDGEFLGPICRIKTSNSVSVTQIWITRVL